MEIRIMPQSLASRPHRSGPVLGSQRADWVDHTALVNRVIAPLNNIRINPQRQLPGLQISRGGVLSCSAFTRP